MEKRKRRRKEVGKEVKERKSAEQMRGEGKKCWGGERRREKIEVGDRGRTKKRERERKKEKERNFVLCHFKK